MARFLLSCFLLMALSACTGSAHRLPTVSEQDVAEVNKELAENKQPLKTYHRSDSQYKKLVTKINNRLLKNAQPLCDHTGYESCFFKTVYSSEDTINAYASEGYKITVFKGLLDYLKTDDEIAAVIAHEMGHHMANHNAETAQNMQAGAAISGILTAVILAAANQNAGYNPYQQQQTRQTIENMSKVGAQIGALSYSKEDEREADLLGQYLLSRAGYDLRKAARVMYVLIKAKPAGTERHDRASFMDTHPAGPERLASWRHVTEEIKSNKSKLPYKLETAAKSASTEVIDADKKPGKKKK